MRAYRLWRSYSVSGIGALRLNCGLDGLKFREIGVVLGVSTSTAQRYYRAALLDVDQELQNDAYASTVRYYRDIVRNAMKAGDLRAATYALVGMRKMLGLDELVRNGGGPEEGHGGQDVDGRGEARGGRQ